MILAERLACRGETSRPLRSLSSDVPAALFAESRGSRPVSKQTAADGELGSIPPDLDPAASCTPQDGDRRNDAPGVLKAA